MVALNQTRNLPTSAADTALKPRKTPPDNNSFPTNRMRSLLRARYYDPHTAEFISTDPLEYVDGMSLFRGYFVPDYVDPFGENVYSIDGTSATRGDGSHVNQIEDSRTEPGLYVDGPTNIWNGNDSPKIRDKMLKQIESDYCDVKDKCPCDHKCTLTINLFGWSRGAAIMLEISHILNASDHTFNCNSGDYTGPKQVNFMGLFDAVRQSSVIANHTTIPANVKSNAHAMKSSQTYTHAVFPTINITNDNERAFHRFNGQTTNHGDIGRNGGKPSAGTSINNISYVWLYNQAKAAGVGLQ